MNVIMKMILNIEMTTTPIIRMASTTMENYRNTRIVIKPIVTMTMTMTMMITHYVFIAKNVNVIPV